MDRLHVWHIIRQFWHPRQDNMLVQQPGEIYKNAGVKWWDVIASPGFRSEGEVPGVYSTSDVRNHNNGHP